VLQQQVIQKEAQEELETSIKSIENEFECAQYNLLKNQQ